jgi:type IV secretory pathway protease TraF
MGATVTVRARDVAPEEARRRHFDGPTDRFIKHVAAVGGARVCGDEQRITISDDVAVVDATARAEHQHETSNPRAWRGCRVLAADEVLLLGDTPDSFDGRYWGPINVSMIEGVWRKL